MSKFLPCKKLCPIVAELKHDVSNRDCEIKQLYRVIDKRDEIIDDLLFQIKHLSDDCDNLAEDNAVLTKSVESLRGQNNENSKRLAKIRQAAFGIVDWGIDVE